MSITIEQIDEFHRFAVQRIQQNGEHELTMDDLLLEWDSLTNHDDSNLAIREGIADVDAGRTRPANEFNQDLRSRYKFGK